MLDHIEPAYFGCSGGRWNEVQEQVDRRGLAGSVCAEQTKDFTRLNLMFKASRAIVPL
jgi:hypothetical protein